MKVTKVEEHALRLALSLARHGGRGSLKELSHRERLSSPLTAKILGKLRRGGVVKALRGRHGCYELVDPPERITVTEVLLAAGPSLLDGCFNTEPRGRPGCPHRSGCTLRPIWNRVESSLTDVLDQITLQDLLRKEAQVERQVVRLLPSPELAAAGPAPRHSRRVRGPRCRTRAHHPEPAANRAAEQEGLAGPGPAQGSCLDVPRPG